MSDISVKLLGFRKKKFKNIYFFIYRLNIRKVLKMVMQKVFLQIMIKIPAIIAVLPQILRLCF